MRRDLILEYYKLVIASIVAIGVGVGFQLLPGNDDVDLNCDRIVPEAGAPAEELDPRSLRARAIQSCYEDLIRETSR